MALVLGMNHPWVSCGHDFGLRPPAWQGAGRGDWDAVECELHAQRDLGIEYSRWWVLAGGKNYPVGRNPDDLFERSESRLGMVFEGKPPPLTREFLEDFEALLKAARASNVRLIPSLVSFEFFFPSIKHSDTIFSGGRGRIVLGRQDQAVEPCVDAFLDATLSPLLELSDRYRDAIGMWEVMNEPDWVVEGGPLHLRIHDGRATIMPKLVAARSMNIFLERALSRIVDSGFVSTVGFKQANPRWLGPRLRERLLDWGRSGRYVHQLHYYPSLHEPRRLPKHDSLPFKPCWIGEMPTAQGRWLDPFHMRWLDGWAWWNEANPSRYLRRRLEIIRGRRYPAALLWSARSDDSASAWNATQQRQLGR